MVKVSTGGSLAFDSTIFGAPPPNLRHYLASQFEAGVQHLTDTGRAFFEQSKKVFEQFNSDQAIRTIKAFGRAAQSLWQTDMIRPITTIGQMQFAPLKMQRWIMAEPEVRKLYHTQRVDGYQGSYVDIEPTLVGRDHYDYRRATTGLFTFTEDPVEEQTPEWTSTTYLDELREGDEELTVYEKADIEHTWECLRMMLDGDEDPTSRFNASLR